MANTNESTLTWLAGGGELGSLVRTYDWSQTPLGPAQQWPLSLRMAVSTCLGSSFPIVIWWGRDLILIYNDPYTSILGNKHPQALGQRGEDCWREVWPLVGPMLERVLDEGKPFTADDLQLMVWRHGYVLITGLSPHKRLDKSYRSFLELLVAQVGSTIADTLAYEAERKRAEELAQLDRAKTTFFSNVSHEFRTPLMLMLGPLEKALSSGEEMLPPLREEITTAHRNALRLLKLVNTLLDFSRIESGRIQASFEPVDISNFTEELASNFRSAIERAGMQLVIDCPPLSEPVWIDREMWEKIVLNLLSNAFKYTFEGGIKVRVLQAHANSVALLVSDTGTGIAKSDLPHIFERFHRIRGARARSHEGSGIGLALVQELVKLHGGTIAVTSALGKGTTFKVHVPTGLAHLPHDRITASRDSASTAIGAAPFVEEALRWLQNAPGEAARDRNSLAETRAQTQNSNPVAERGGKILIADDNADMRDYVQRLLADQYDVETTPEGGSALLAARERTPDLILTDIMMPGMDGLELLRALRADSRTNQIPIILLSARAGEESKVEGLDAGADDYLVKPFTARELRARVKSHLNIARERRLFAQELSSRLSELEKANAEIRDARRAALNVLEDAVEARERAKQRYDKLQERADWLHGQCGALEVALNGAPLEVSLGVLVRTATEALGRETRAAFYLAHGDEATLRHVVGKPVEYAAGLKGFQFEPQSLAPGSTTRAQEQVVIIEVLEDPWWEPRGSLAERFGYRGIWNFPINASTGKLVGALVIYLAQLRKPDKREMELAGLLTNTASIIISRQKESEARQRIE